MAQVITSQMPFVLPNQRCQALKESQSTDPNPAKLPTGLILSSPTIGLPREGTYVAFFSTALQHQKPCFRRWLKNKATVKCDVSDDWTHYYYRL